MTDLPARIERAAVERIIQRAAELQTGEHDLGEGLTSEELLGLGRDVGIPERYLRQALLEEQGRVEGQSPGGLLDRWFGPASVTAQRVVRGEGDALERRLLAWMEEEELLTVQRQQPGRVSWEPLTGVPAAIRRSTAALGRHRPFMLRRARLITATITPLEPGYCHVVLAADLGPARGGAVAGGLAVGTAAATAALLVTALTPLGWIAVVPLALGLGVASVVGRQYRPVAARTRLGLERALDRLERGEVKPAHALPATAPGGLLGQVVEEIRRIVKP